jgi:RNA polymerase-binding transcription factor DksA
MTKAAKKSAGQPVADEVRVESPFSDEFIAQQKAVLLAERARYVKSADALKAEADSLANEREPGDVQFDEESGEGDTLAVERERDLALSAQARAAVDLIDAALVRIENGTYGICQHSGQPIPEERLEAIPWAAERVEFKAGSFRS